MNSQRTLRRSISCAGIGLHSGNKVTLSLKPAPAGSGLDRGADDPDAAPAGELLASRLPAMLVSRLYEMAQPVLMTSLEDFRREHKVHGARLR